MNLSIFIVVTGWVSLVTPNLKPSGEKTVIADFGPGTILGEEWLY